MSTYPRPSKHNGLDARGRRPLPTDPALAQRRFQKLPEVYYHHSPYFHIPSNDKPLQPWDPSKRVKYRPPVSQEKVPYGPRGKAIAPYPGGRPYDVPAHIQSFYRPYRERDAFEARLPKGYRFMKAKSEYQHTYFHSAKEIPPIEYCHAVEVEEPIFHLATENVENVHSVEIVQQVEVTDYRSLMLSRLEKPKPEVEIEPTVVVPVEDTTDLQVSPEVKSPLKRYNETYLFVIRLLIIGKVDTDQNWSAHCNCILVVIGISLRSIVHLRIVLLALFVYSLVDFSPTS